MKLKFFAALALTLSTAGVARAEITVADAYVRAAMPSAPSAAAYMVLRNDGAEADRLVSASAEIAARTMLHQSAEDTAGVMRMDALAQGVVIPAGAERALAPGGTHVMLMGLSRPLAQGAQVELLLTFERAGEIRLSVPVEIGR